MDNGLEICKYKKATRINYFNKKRSAGFKRRNSMDGGGKAAVFVVRQLGVKREGGEGEEEKEGWLDE
jgi:hypothetical protein